MTDYKKLIDEVLAQPGKISDCYRMFHDYSFNNQILAMAQVGAQPINTFMGWKALGRSVKKGEKAIALCMPVTITDKEDKDKKKTIFILKNNWFGLSQTEGDDVTPVEVPGFNEAKVLEVLEIEKVPFERTNGNVQGYATKNKIAINPVAAHPVKTLFHEIAHVILGHTTEISFESGTRSIQETEAETVAYILSNVFGQTDNLEESRGYIQGWNNKEGISEASASKIIRTVEKILKANR